MDLYIRVNVLDVEDVIYCGSNEVEENRRKDDPDNNVWLNMEGNYFKLKYCRCCEYTVDNLGYMTGSNITQYAIASCNNSGAMNDAAIIVLHRTAGGVASGTLNHMSTQGYGAHFVIDNAANTDGEIYHAISLNNRGAHIGVAQYQATIDAGWGNHNSVGIEVCGYSYDANGNVNLANNHSYWQDVTNEQAHSTACLVKFLLRHLSLSRDDIKVHEELCNKTEGEGQTVYDAMINFWH
jgi:N-acetyl-anhydromuramyl-L-alanine amidase AmpD